MTTHNQELISAYLDNELNDIERAQFEKRLAEDEVLAREFETFQQNDIAIKQEYSAIDDKPVPDSIMALLGQSHTEGQSSNNRSESFDAETPSKEPERDNKVVPFKPRAEKPAASNSNPQSGSKKWFSIAASIAVVALCIPVFLSTNQESYTSLATVLNTQASGERIQLADDKQIHLTMSFTNNKGDFCREYLLSESSSHAHTVSCHQNGVWKTQVSSQLDAINNEHYQPASGEMSAEIETWLDSHMASDPLSQQQEQKQLNIIKR